MKPLPHRYDVRLTGGPAGYATLNVPGLPDLATAPPSDFDGPGDAWSPEHLLLAAVETCFLFTLRAVAQASRIEFTSLDLSAEGTVDRRDSGMRFTEIVLRPRLRLPAGADEGKARRAMEKSEKGVPGHRLVVCPRAPRAGDRRWLRSFAPAGRLCPSATAFGRFPPFRARVLADLLLGTATEYQEAYNAGKITRLVEYQDAYAFFMRAQAVQRDLAPRLSARGIPRWPRSSTDNSRPFPRGRRRPTWGVLAPLPRSRPSFTARTGAPLNKRARSARGWPSPWHRACCHRLRYADGRRGVQSLGSFDAGGLDARAFRRKGGGSDEPRHTSSRIGRPLGQGLGPSDKTLPLAARVARRGRRVLGRRDARVVDGRPRLGRLRVGGPHGVSTGVGHLRIRVQPGRELHVPAARHVRAPARSLAAAAPALRGTQPDRRADGVRPDGRAHRAGRDGAARPGR